MARASVRVNCSGLEGGVEKRSAVVPRMRRPAISGARTYGSNIAASAAGATSSATISGMASLSASRRVTSGTGRRGRSATMPDSPALWPSRRTRSVARSSTARCSAANTATLCLASSLTPVTDTVGTIIRTGSVQPGLPTQHVVRQQAHAE